MGESGNEIMDRIRVNMRREITWDMRKALGCVVKCLLLLAVLWSTAARWTAVAQVDVPADRSNMDLGAISKPEPVPDDSDRGPDKEPNVQPTAPSAVSTSICLLVESAAQAHGLPIEFFTRLIWQESGFKPNAVGPMTRSGQQAQGIAQFMPGTASERGLLDLFDPVAALPKSAEFLQELQAHFGNLGLAAAAYNAGAQRVRDWMAGRGTLPAETRNYVIAITGHGADEWATGSLNQHDAPFAKRTSCRELISILKEQRSPFVGELARRIHEGVTRPWGVELSAGFGQARVLAAYATIEKTYRAILENRDPIIIASRFLSRGMHTFYQVRVGTDTRESANQLCAALHKAGGICLVLRNWVGKSRPL